MGKTTRKSTTTEVTADTIKSLYAEVLQSEPLFSPLVEMVALLLPLHIEELSNPKTFLSPSVSAGKDRRGKRGVQIDAATVKAIKAGPRGLRIVPAEQRPSTRKLNPKGPMFTVPVIRWHDAKWSAKGTETIDLNRSEYRADDKTISSVLLWALHESMSCRQIADRVVNLIAQVSHRVIDPKHPLYTMTDTGAIRAIRSELQTVSPERLVNLWKGDAYPRHWLTPTPELNALIDAAEAECKVHALTATLRHFAAPPKATQIVRLSCKGSKEHFNPQYAPSMSPKAVTDNNAHATFQSKGDAAIDALLCGVCKGQLARYEVIKTESDDGADYEWGAIIEPEPATKKSGIQLRTNGTGNKVVVTADQNGTAVPA